MAKRNKPRGIGGQPNMMQQFQRVQAQMEEVQNQLAEETVTTSVGGGAIKIVIDGKQNVRSITIAPDLASSGDVEMLQDMIVAGMNEAVAKSQEMAAEHLGKLTGGLNIPGLF